MVIQKWTSRVLLLGASNLSMELSTAVRMIGKTLPGPIDFHIADGFGRSYGSHSKFLTRELPGTLECDLWSAVETLQEKDELPIYALITDIGNDIAYEVEPIEIGKWVEECVSRLEKWGARVVMTRLPVESLLRLSSFHLNTVRNILFPSCRLTVNEIQHRVHELDNRIVSIAEDHGIPLVGTDLLWYGLDPVHIRRRYWAGYWGNIIRNWSDGVDKSQNEVASEEERLRADPLLWCYMWSRWAKRRRVLGGIHERLQPSGRLSDGSIISVY